MDLGGLADKAKKAVNDNRDQVEDKAGEAIDKVTDGDKAEKAKSTLKDGLDKLSGK
ncbi:MAG: hypothetical protein ACI38U_05040 [Corynebacterium sp.]|jgi:hypothetical protein|uniref:hypothetical protein n=1 Tax=unclassified Corynebacterium TaxID=2624378 RepID=UPI000AD0737B|nr:hypothetical protein [Corynebacterium sp. CNJ-954]